MFNLHIIDGPAICAPLTAIMQHVLPCVQRIIINNKQKSIIIYTKQIKTKYF